MGNPSMRHAATRLRIGADPRRSVPWRPCVFFWKKGSGVSGADELRPDADASRRHTEPHAHALRSLDARTRPHACARHARTDLSGGFFFPFRRMPTAKAEGPRPIARVASGSARRGPRPSTAHHPLHRPTGAPLAFAVGMHRDTEKQNALGHASCHGCADHAVAGTYPPVRSLGVGRVLVTVHRRRASARGLPAVVSAPGIISYAIFVIAY